jgi:hypothetical protein
MSKVLSIGQAKAWQLACGFVSVVAILGLVITLARSRAAAPDTWKLVDALGSAGLFADVPENSLLLAPNLWQRLPNPTPGGGDHYLSTYLSNLAGRSIAVSRDGDDVFDRLRRGSAVYYCDHQWIPGRNTSVLLVSRLEATHEAGPIQSDHMIVVASMELRNLALEYRSSAPGQREISPGYYEAPVVAWRQAGRAFVAEASVPGLVPGTARLVDDETGTSLQVGVEIKFARGFTPLTERVDGHYYRWSNGADGEAEFDLYNALDRPLTGSFRTVVRFNPILKTGTFDFTGPGGKETIHCDNGGVVKRVWTLKPGSNPIVVKCHETRMSSPGDSRYIVFGFWDWLVGPAGATAATSQ